MFIISNFIVGIAKVLDLILGIYMWIVIIRAIASWFAMDPYNPIYQFLVRITEPVLGYVRRLIPLRAGMVDFSPIIVILVIIFLQSFLVQSLFGIAHALR